MLKTFELWKFKLLFTFRNFSTSSVLTKDALDTAHFIVWLWLKFWFKSLLQGRDFTLGKHASSVLQFVCQGIYVALSQYPKHVRIKQSLYEGVLHPPFMPPGSIPSFQLCFIQPQIISSKQPSIVFRKEYLSFSDCS